MACTPGAPLPRSLVRDASSASGWYVDATPAYASSVVAMLQLRATLPAARLVLMMRDPTARAQSAWSQNRRAAAAVEQRSFSTAVAEELWALDDRCAVGGTFREAQSTASNASELERSEELAVAVASRVASRLVAWEGTALLTARRRWSPEDTQLLRAVASARCSAARRSCWLRPVSTPAPRDCKMYLARGLAAPKLREWRRRFGVEGMLILRLDDVVANGTKAAAQLAAYRTVASTAAASARHAILNPERAHLLRCRRFLSPRRRRSRPPTRPACCTTTAA